MTIQLKRAYDALAAGDGLRILVDKFWPRGVGKEDAALDEWRKEVAPSDELREGKPPRPPMDVENRDESCATERRRLWKKIRR